MSQETKEYYQMAVAKANLLDMVIAMGFILPSMLEKCVLELDPEDQETLQEFLEEHCG